MSHAIRDKAKLIARVRRIKGQIVAVERALEAEAACGEVLRQLASIRGAMSGLTGQLMEEHLREHVLAAPTKAERAQGAEEMIQVLRTYLK